MTGVLSGARSPVNPLRQLTLDQLRQRTSLKWREYPDDVLPLWVAEMDVPLAEPVARAVTDAVALGDTGYPSGTAYAAGAGGVRPASVGLGRARPWSAPRSCPTSCWASSRCSSWSPARGTRWWSTARSTRRSTSSWSTRTAGSWRRRSAQDLRIDLDTLEDAFRRARAGRRPAAYLLCSPHNPTGVLHTADELAAVAASGRTARGAGGRRRDPRAGRGCRARASCRTCSVPGAENGMSLMSASKAWNLAGLQGGARGRRPGGGR